MPPVPGPPPTSPPNPATSLARPGPSDQALREPRARFTRLGSTTRQLVAVELVRRDHLEINVDRFRNGTDGAPRARFCHLRNGGARHRGGDPAVGRADE